MSACSARAWKNYTHRFVAFLHGFYSSDIAEVHSDNGKEWDRAEDQVLQMIKWQLVVVRPNKLFIGNSRLISHETLSEVITFTTRTPGVTRTGPRFDIRNKERSRPPFKESCMSLAESLLVCLLQGKKGVSLQRHLKTAILVGIGGELLVLAVEEMREGREQFELLLFFLPA